MPEPWKMSRPSWMNISEQKPRKQIGDAPAMVAEYILHDVHPFPGDEHFPQDGWEVNN